MLGALRCLYAQNHAAHSVATASGTGADLLFQDLANHHMAIVGSAGRAGRTHQKPIRACNGHITSMQRLALDCRKVCICQRSTGARPVYGSVICVTPSVCNQLDIVPSTAIIEPSCGMPVKKRRIRKPLKVPKHQAPLHVVPVNDTDRIGKTAAVPIIQKDAARKRELTHGVPIDISGVVAPLDYGIVN